MRPVIARVLSTTARRVAPLVTALPVIGMIAASCDGRPIGPDTHTDGGTTVRDGAPIDPPGPRPGTDGGVLADGGRPVGEDGGTGDAGTAACSAWETALRPTFWSLPSGYDHFNGWAAGSAYCYDGRDEPEHVVVDIDGDGHPDLVILADCDDPTVGVSRWRVHLGTPTGFAASPTFWGLPSGYDHYNGWAATSAYCYDGRDEPAHIVSDIDGDGRLDLVVTTDCDDREVGVSRWRVFRGQANGFAPTATYWSLPPGYDHFNGWAATSAYCYDGRDEPAHLVADIDGDRRPDLVVTTDCDDRDVGVRRWRVFRGEASGYAPNATDWSLPTGYDRFNGWTATSAYCYEGRDEPAHVVADMDADGRLDLVVTADCDDREVGVRSWRVFRGEANGFAASASGWLLPPGYDHFNGWAANSAYCYDGRDEPAHIVTDVDGDRRLDLVVTRDCEDDTVGESRWRVYRNHGTGFEAAGASLSLPLGYDHFNGWAAGSAYCYEGRDEPAHVITDINGDGRVDFVVTADCDDSAVGRLHWRVFLQRCADVGQGACLAGPEDGPAQCGDACSNDADAQIDCDDPDCNGIGSCVFHCPEGPENTPAACSDGCSNDGDAYTDCDDWDCAGIGACPARCAMGPENTVAACSDRCSNDGDTYIDCNDWDCAGIGTCPPR